jgi:hypothetical protein
MSELPLDSKIHKEHPEHPDNHPLRKHHPHHEAILRLSGIFLLCVIFLAFLLGLVTNAPFGIVLLSFVPSILLSLSVMAFAHADNLHIEHLVTLLLTLLIVFGLIITGVSSGADVFAVMSLNLIIGALFILALQQSYRQYEKPKLPGVVHERLPDQRELSGLFVDIEERSKSINTAIGRTYSVYKGATAGMREKIKIASSLYSELDSDKKHSVLRDHLTEIAARLALLKEKEKEIFTSAEYKKLNRSKDVSVLDTLSEYEGEGVLQSHASATAYVQQSLSQLD